MNKEDVIIEALNEILEELKGNYDEHHPNNNKYYSFHIERLINVMEKLYAE